MELAQMIDRHTNAQPEKLLEIGCGSGFLSQKLLHSYPGSHFYINDLVAEAEARIRMMVPEQQQGNIQFMAGDAESLDFPDELELVASASTVQWFSHLDLFFERLSRRMKQEGVLAFSTFGQDNYKEISALTQQGINYPDMETIAGYLLPHYSLLESRERKIVLQFDHPIDVLKHIRLTGVKGHLGQKWTKRELNHFVEAYQERFSLDEKVQLTYHPLYFVCKKG